MRRALTVLLLIAAPTLAAEEDRGLRGFYLATGGGVALGSATDAEGADAGSFFGNGGYLRVGEEALPGLTLGLVFGGLGGQAESERYGAGIGGFVLQVGWRPFADLVVTGGFGVGGGGLSPEDDGDPEGSAGGALYQLGASYEIFFWGGERHGRAAAPAASWLFVPSFDGSPVQLSAFLIGVDLVWYAGRG